MARWLCWLHFVNLPQAGVIWKEGSQMRNIPTRLACGRSGIKYNFWLQPSIFTYIYIHVPTCMQTWIYTYNTHMHTCASTSTNAHTHIHTYTQFWQVTHKRKPLQECLTQIHTHTYNSGKLLMKENDSMNVSYLTFIVGCWNLRLQFPKAKSNDTLANLRTLMWHVMCYIWNVSQSLS